MGTSLSLVAPSEEELLQRTESQFTGGAGALVLHQRSTYQQSLTSLLLRMYVVAELRCCVICMPAWVSPPLGPSPSGSLAICLCSERVSCRC